MYFERKIYINMIWHLFFIFVYLFYFLLFEANKYFKILTLKNGNRKTILEILLFETINIDIL